MMYYIISLILILFAVLGSPLFVIILAVAITGFYYLKVDLSVIAFELYRIADTPVLLALPLFTFSGYMLGETQTSKRLVRLTQAFLGWMPGGLAIVAFVACAFFTAFTGASGVTIVALGALLYPALIQAGYKEKFSLGLIATSGSLGLLFPPSLPLILYGIIAQQMNIGKTVSVEDLFIAGILPSLLMILMLSCWSMWENRHIISLRKKDEYKDDLQKKTGGIKEAVAACREAIWEIPLPFFVLGGIYSGFFAVSEAATATAVYIHVIEVLIYREIKISQLPDIMRESMIVSGGILLILGASLASTNFLIDAEVPTRLFDFVQSHVTDRFVFLIILNLFLLLLGAVLDIFSALVIMVPLILPVAVSYGVDPVHLGIIFLANMQIGYVTPPVGMNLFIASYRFEKSVSELYRATVPFMIVLFLAVLIITYIPELSLIFLTK